jgi:hypothetical protein
MKKIWEAIKRFFGWKPKVPVPVPVNNFNDWHIDERRIAMLMNIVREENKPLSLIKRIGGVFYSPLNIIPDLIPNKLLWEEAIKRCEVQSDREQVSHDGVGVAFKAILGEGYSYPAEILAYAYTKPESVVNAWYNSDSHKKIVLKPSYIYYGVAQREYNNKKFYCVLFCS